jgi:DNA repair ATPase RecN
MSSEYALLRHTVEAVEKRTEAAHGSIEAINGRLFSLDLQTRKLTKLMHDALEYMQTLQTEMLRSLHASEEAMAQTRKVVDVMAVQQGRLLQEVAELQRVADETQGFETAESIP